MPALGALIGVLRLRLPFAKRMEDSAQDDTLRLELEHSAGFDLEDG